MTSSTKLIVLQELLLGLIVYTTQELWQSRETAKPSIPLDTRLWTQAALIGIVSYISAWFQQQQQQQQSSQHKGGWTGRFISGIAIGIPYFQLSAIAMGAPFISLANRTLAWSLIMASLVSGPLAVECSSLSDLRLPPAYKGPKGERWIIRWQSLGTALGAWLGATFVPLDWAMPFQEYPLSLVVGTVLGHQVATVAFLLFSKRLQLAAKEP